MIELDRDRPVGTRGPAAAGPSRQALAARRAGLVLLVRLAREEKWSPGASAVRFHREVSDELLVRSLRVHVWRSVADDRPTPVSQRMLATLDATLAHMRSDRRAPRSSPGPAPVPHGPPAAPGRIW